MILIAFEIMYKLVLLEFDEKKKKVFQAIYHHPPMSREVSWPYIPLIVTYF